MWISFPLYMHIIDTIKSQSKIISLLISKWSGGQVVGFERDGSCRRGECRGKVRNVGRHGEYGQEEAWGVWASIGGYG